MIIGAVRLFAIALASLTMSGCVSMLRPCDGSSYPSFFRHSLVRRVTLAEVKRDWLAGMEIGTLPAEAQAGVIQSVEKSIETFRMKTLPTDELWTYRFEKCPGCRWYTEGVVALRGSCIEAELTLRDDM
jgi:hypothetical protein